MRRPSALQLVAWLFSASGVWAALSIAGALFFEHRIDLALEVLGLWIGPGLLRYESRYRTWALRLLIFDFCMAPVAVLLLIMQPGPLALKFLGRPAGTVSLAVALTALALMVGVSIWQYWVLRQPSIQALFTRRPAEHSEASV